MHSQKCALVSVYVNMKSIHGIGLLVFLCGSGSLTGVNLKGAIYRPSLSEQFLIFLGWTNACTWACM